LAVPAWPTRDCLTVLIGAITVTLPGTSKRHVDERERTVSDQSGTPSQGGYPPEPDPSQGYQQGQGYQKGPAPQQGQGYPGQYGAPGPYPGGPYGAPPQYGAPPAYGAPQYGGAQYGGPQYGAPQGFGMPPQYGPPQVPSMWARLGARILDGLIFAIPFSILTFIVVGSSSNGFSNFGTTFQSSFTGSRIALSVLSYLAFAVYQILMIARTGSTVGKKVVGVRVVSEDGRPATMRQSVIRWAVYSGPTIIPIFGTLYALVLALSPFFDTPRRQGFHDKAAHTVVVPR